MYIIPLEENNITCSFIPHKDFSRQSREKYDNVPIQGKNPLVQIDVFYKCFTKIPPLQP